MDQQRYANPLSTGDLPTHNKGVFVVSSLAVRGFYPKTIWFIFILYLSIKPESVHWTSFFWTWRTFQLYIWSNYRPNSKTKHQKIIRKTFLNFGFCFPQTQSCIIQKKQQKIHVGRLELHWQKSESCDWFDPLEDCKLPGRDFWWIGLMVLSGGHRCDSWKTHQKIITATRKTKTPYISIQYFYFLSTNASI